VWRLRARGKTLDGSGTATVTASLRAIDAGAECSRLEIDADVRLAGTIAESVGSVDAVVDRLVSDFAALLARTPQAAVSPGLSISPATSRHRAIFIAGALISGGVAIRIARRFARRTRSSKG
jgi:hypothetical protein